MIRKVERKIKAKYRKMCGWCFLIALVIGLVLGFVLARQLFPAQANGGGDAATRPTPVAAAPAGTDAAAPSAPTQEATPVVTGTPTPEPTPVPTPTPNPLEEVGKYFGLSADDLGITQAATATPTPTPTATPVPTATATPAPTATLTPVSTPTQPLVQVLSTPTPEAGALLTITPTPAVLQVGTDALAASAGPTQEVQPTQPAQVQQDPNAKGGKNNPYLLDEAFTFETEVLPSGLPRTNVADTEYDTVRVTIALNNYMTPEYFQANYASQYRLTGTEAGAKLTMSVDSSTGTSAIKPQDAFKIVFESESGLEVDGYQLIDAEIAGLSGITLQPGQTQIVYKRFVYNENEALGYLVVKYYQGGQEYKAYFKLEEGEEIIHYQRLSSGSRGDAVKNLQQRLIDLGYLDDSADGILGGNTVNAIRAAQEQAGMEVTGAADDVFQQYIFSTSAQPAE